MNPKILLSLPDNGGQNYKNAFCARGFDVTGDYLTYDTDADALVLCGGGDIHPSFYSEPFKGSMPADIQRDKCEFFLFEKYFAAKKPIFGICRGMQLINVAMGGKLIQHMPDAHLHKGFSDIVHTISNLDGTPVYTLFGKSMTVNSAHHQCCETFGDGLFVMQRHSDGTAEGLFGQQIIAVQWHPERMTKDFKNDSYTSPDALFGFFRDMIINRI